MAAAAGGHHSILLRDDGEAVAFGNNEVGQCAIRDIFHGFGLALRGLVFKALSGGRHSLARVSAHVLTQRRFVRGRCVPDWRSLVLLVVYKGEDSGLRKAADALGPRELSRRLMRH